MFLKKEAAASAVGARYSIFLIKIFKYPGLRVFATGPKDHLEALKSLGTERLINYSRTEATLGGL